MENNLIINQNNINLNNNTHNNLHNNIHNDLHNNIHNNLNNNQNNNINNNIELLSKSFSNLDMTNCNNILNINDISKKINNEQELDAFLEHIKEENSSRTDENIEMHKELLEVRNRQNTKYFDDEDFIYCKFELPPKIIEEISHTGKDFIDYFENLLDNFESNFEFENYEVYCNTCILFQYISLYYLNIKNNITESKNNYFSNDFLLILKNVCHDIICDCCLNSSDSSYTYFHDYTKEVMHGLKLIITQLSAIIQVLDCHNYQDINKYPIKYKKKVLKLVNNMCVILFFIKFYYNQPDFNFETTEEEDVALNFGNLVAKEWQIKYTSKKVREEIKNTFQQFNQQNLQQANQQNDESIVINGVANMEIS